MDCIVMATDLSARSDRALERAVRLANDRGAKLSIVHVIDDDLPEAVIEVQRSTALQMIGEHVAKLASDASPRPDINVVTGRPHAEIVELAARSRAQLIVLGLHRHGSNPDLFRGTTAERVIRAGSVPVLLVKDRVRGPYRRALVGVDFSDCSKIALTFALSFLPQASLHVVHAYDVPFAGFLRGEETRDLVRKQHQAELEALVAELGAAPAGQGEGARTVDCILQAGTVRDVINAQVERLQPDILVIGTHGRSGMARALLGSVAEDLLRDPPCDVLAVKAP